MTYSAAREERGEDCPRCGQPLQGARDASETEIREYLYGPPREITVGTGERSR